MTAARDTRVDFSCSLRRHLPLFLVLEENATDRFHGVFLVAMVPRTLKGTEAISTEAMSLRLPAGLITRRRKPLSPPCESSVPSGPSAKPTLCSIAGAGRQDRTPLSRLASSVAAPRGCRHTVPCPCGETPFRKPCRPTSRSLASGQLHLTPDSAVAPALRPVP